MHPAIDHHRETAVRFTKLDANGQPTGETLLVSTSVTITKRVHAPRD